MSQWPSGSVDLSQEGSSCCRKIPVTVRRAKPAWSRGGRSLTRKSCIPLRDGQDWQTRSVHFSASWSPYPWKRPIRSRRLFATARPTSSRKQQRIARISVMCPENNLSLQPAMQIKVGSSNWEPHRGACACRFCSKWRVRYCRRDGGRAWACVDTRRWPSGRQSFICPKNHHGIG